jgi:hypothetical protein
LAAQLCYHRDVNALRASAIVITLCCLACSKPGEGSEAKRSPIPEPAPGATVPSDLAIPVELDGAVVMTIRAEMLEARKPDFEDTERKAWRLDKILDAKTFPPGSILEASGSDGVGISMHRPKNEDEPLPVVALTRRGELVAAIVKASDPFPDYHGQGGRLHRPGDPLPRLLTNVVRLRVSAAGAKVETAIPTIKTLKLQIGDSPAVAISAELVEALPSSTVMGDSGGQRTRWNLRDLVKATAGESAVLTEVVGASESEIAEEQWKDADKRPVLQENRRGELKFQWVDGKSKASEEGSVRSVRLLKIRR